MVQALSDAIHARLVSDETLAGMLAPYRGKPAAFTGRTVPTDAVAPYAHVRPVSDGPYDTLKARGRDVTRDVVFFGSDTTSDARMSDLVERARGLFHRQPLTVAGYHVVSLAVVDAGPAPDEAGINGRVVTIRALLRETS
jgi:hypothetical protein